ncbi:mono and diacylglycerol lipase [Staphylotrichum tortipilum]|uniref:Mono and diacylglycerol lipase n=1 Tax=Staphylotrichum tortipilum TaxID=2831512 RepID=A0AAN6MSZ1_9PEZI|nr:mono and diacylglycerol lipase [Staphylotrichum longicolle]
MGFFVRSKKVKKDSPAVQSKDRTQAPSQHRTVSSDPSQTSQPRHPGSPPPYQQLTPFQPAGLLPPPPSYNGGSPSTAYRQPGTHPPIIVNQHHYYLGAPHPLQPPARSCRSVSTPLGKLDLGPAVDLAKEVYQGTCVSRCLGEALPCWHSCGGQLVSQSNALVDEISDRLNHVLTMIDQGGCDGREHDILAWQPGYPPFQPPPSDHPHMSDKGGSSRPRRKSHSKEHPKGQTTAAAAVVSGSFFAKVELYANSRLPMNLPPLKLYIPTYPLLCLAAQYSERVYEPPNGRAERDAHIDGDWRGGTKAMVIKSVPMDYMNTIVFAVRGTASFMDWAVNLNMEPTSPRGFLDDLNNLCHAGFLSVARKMISPVARRLRQLLEEDPNRASYSLLITGHSAGGAVAALLYSHMLSSSPDVESELSIVAGCFKRIHCVTFGTPPVSLYPLTKPDDYHRRPQLRKSLFMSFVNEGDPVARADKAYMKSLLELFAAPAPTPKTESSRRRAESETRRSRSSRTSTDNNKSRSSSSQPAHHHSGPVWRVPRCALSCAGRVVVLRSGEAAKGRRPRSGERDTVAERLDEGVVAQIVTDEELRGIVWGDPVAHMMRLYAGRIEVLAVGAVTAKGY